MRRNPELFAKSVYYDNMKYTPQRAMKYFSQVPKIEDIQWQQLNVIIGYSQRRLVDLVEQHGLTMDQKLRKEESDAGREIAELVHKHYEKVSKLTK